MMIEFSCHYCFEINAILLYREEGEQQSFIVDCEVCCHPLKVQASWDHFSENFNIDISPGLD